MPAGRSSLPARSTGRSADPSAGTGPCASQRAPNESASPCWGRRAFVAFDASGSHDPDGSIVAFAWTFGDGSSDSHLNRTPTHVHASSGTHAVTLKVTDGVGGTDEAFATIVVSPGSGGDPGGSVASVTIDGGDRQLGVGETVRLAAIVDTSEGVDRGVIWNSSVSGVASVDPTGSVTGIVTGVTTIAAADPSVDWTSANPAVVSIGAGGYVTAIAEGIAVIQATGVFDTTRSDSVAVSVIDASSLRFEFGRELIAAGASHTLFIGDDGTVWAWGSNTSGQLGVDPVETGRIAPVHVPGVAAAAAVAAGAAFSLVNTSDGRVWAWGENGSGHLSGGTLTSRNVPEAILELTDATAIAAGSAHALAPLADGTIYAWGKNDKGQLGDASNTDKRTPTRVPGLANVVAIAAGANQSLAVTDTGAVWARGENDAGQLGGGTTRNRNEPVQVASLTSIRGVTAGSAHSLASDASGRLWAWGRNLDVQLGEGSEGVTRSSPVRIDTTNDARMVAAGALDTVLLTAEGPLRAWGRNVDGQLGISSGTDLFASPRTLRERLSKVTAVSVAEWHSLALVDGWLWSWGRDQAGALGHGTSFSGLHLPRPVMAMASPSSIAAGPARWGGVSATIDAPRDLWTWGDNDQGVLGHGSTTEATSPTRLTSVSNVADVTVGQAFLIARIDDGTLWSWGRNSQGQLGIGSTTSSSTPARLTTLTTVSSVAAGTTHAIALRADGTVWTWGENLSGQLGDGTTTGKTSPTPISFGGNPRITARHSWKRFQPGTR